MAKLKTVTKEITLPEALWNDLEPLFKERDLTLSEVTRLYLRSLVISTKKNAPIGLQDVLTFGKYKDETLELVLKVEPDYITWLLRNKEGFTLQPEALSLHEELTGPEAATS